ncbi:bacillithiol system redox-active protein YtxJ [Gracilimonas mengyeensis]|uniref:Bacillithiol system protein YtxJ n=1 Tax=Gracilimonas mengyeensis TaxID=1302730 RepID=A0A521C2Q0_9BACT|nr:bacillithiol system redox-active protein YtxJ [Gracilimonas mengyeensis]SMO53679.1 bacillithiol system protein YtxJ [Gracilimonas mengyeensis]
MGFFDTLFGGEGEDNASSTINWENIHSEEELDDILMASNQKPQVIYKHSPRCATSFFALKNLKALSAEDARKADFYLVDVIAERSISNLVAEKLGIRHESPQLFIIKNGDVQWHGSHHQVNSDVVEGQL